MTEKTPGPMPTINDDTKIKTDLKTVIAVIGTVGAVLIAGTMWLTTVHNDIRGLQADVNLIKQALGLDQPRLVMPKKTSEGIQQ